MHSKQTFIEIQLPKGFFKLSVVGESLYADTNDDHISQSCSRLEFALPRGKWRVQVKCIRETSSPGCHVGDFVRLVKEEPESAGTIGAGPENIRGALQIRPTDSESPESKLWRDTFKPVYEQGPGTVSISIDDETQLMSTIDAGIYLANKAVSAYREAMNP